MPRACTWSAERVYRFSVFGSPGVRSRWMPSMPVASRAAAARYGFAEPSTERISMRPGAGMRIACVRLFMPYVAYAGDHVAPDVGAPTPMRLYEFTVGAMTAMPDSMCSM